MDNDFVKMAEMIIDKEGKDPLLDPNRTKALFKDYGRCEFKNELNLLVKAIELGHSKKIKDSKDLNSTKMILLRELIEEQFINNKMANNIILLLMGLLRDKSYLKEIHEIINNNVVVKNDDNNRNKDNKKRIEVSFRLNDILYVARSYYPEIIEKDNPQQQINEMDIARQVLKNHGKDVPRDANKMNTHSAIRKLINVLEKERKKEVK